MNLVAVLVGLTMLVISVPFVAKPFQKVRGKKPATPVKQVDPDEQRLAALTALRDLDFDFQVGKVSEDDYTSLRARLVAEAAQYLQDDKNDDIEALIQARKASKAKAAACAHCGETLEAGIRFCPRCGTAVEDSCPSCGKNLNAGDVFCSSCGTQLAIQTGTVA
jgi:NADH pyrophosphatase NudC (nudix superfamily)